MEQLTFLSSLIQSVASLIFIGIGIYIRYIVSKAITPFQERYNRELKEVHNLLRIILEDIAILKTQVSHQNKIDENFEKCLNELKNLYITLSERITKLEAKQK